jgi:hypothetical protein
MQILRSLLVLSLFFTSFSVKSQSADAAEHLTFKGVPIDGTLDDYVTNMKKAGFTLVSVENGLALFSGDFAGYKECIIGVVTLDGKDLVSKVTVVFPKRDTWSDLESNYSKLKELLTIKYGEPESHAEKFNSTYQPSSDIDKMYELLMERCEYSSSFELDNGAIQLSIEHAGYAFVMLAYFDKTNTEEIRQKALDDL